MKGFLRAQFEARAPGLFHAIRALRHRRFFRREFSAIQESAKRQLYPDGKPIVIETGPFRGLRYLDETVWGSITPKWLGSYESELHPVIEWIIEHPYTTIIDVGCAEGYYAVGLAVTLPGATVIAFDIDFISRKQLSRLARLNHVANRISIRTRCDFADLDALAQGRTLVICDIEGFESRLLDPERAPSLIRSDILVEVHEGTEAAPDCRALEELLLSRFSASHRIDRILATDRDSWIVQNCRNIFTKASPQFLRQAAEENRADGRVWLWMQAIEA